MKNKILLMILLIPLLTTSCTNKQKGQWYKITSSSSIEGYINKDSDQTNSVDPFNTVMVCNYFVNNKITNSEEIINNVSNIYNEEVDRLHKIFDRHYYYKDNDGNFINNLKVLNDSFGTNEYIKVDKELYDCLKLSISLYSITNGYFNIFIGTLSDFWEDKLMIGYEYGAEAIDPYFNEEYRLELIDITNNIPNTYEDYTSMLDFNDNDYSVRFNNIYNVNTKLSISLGGIAKGYSTDIIQDKLVSNGYKDGILNSGSSTFCSIDETIINDNKGQAIRTLDPNTIASEAFHFYVKDKFYYSTSGNYTDGKRYKFYDNDNNLIYRHHIINPFTGYPMSYYRSVSILSNDISNAYLDVFSTTFMNASKEEGKTIKSNIEEYLNKSLDIIYLEQKGLYEEYTLQVYSTSSINNTLKPNKELKRKHKITINYEY